MFILKCFLCQRRFALVLVFGAVPTGCFICLFFVSCGLVVLEWWWVALSWSKRVVWYKRSLVVVCNNLLRLVLLFIGIC